MGMSVPVTSGAVFLIFLAMGSYVFTQLLFSQFYKNKIVGLIFRHIQENGSVLSKLGASLHKEWHVRGEYSQLKESGYADLSFSIWGKDRAEGKVHALCIMHESTWMLLKCQVQIGEETIFIEDKLDDDLLFFYNSYVDEAKTFTIKNNMFKNIIHGILFLCLFASGGYEILLIYLIVPIHFMFFEPFGDILADKEEVGLSQKTPEALRIRHVLQYYELQQAQRRGWNAIKQASLLFLFLIVASNNPYKSYFESDFSFISDATVGRFFFWGVLLFVIGNIFRYIVLIDEAVIEDIRKTLKKHPRIIEEFGSSVKISWSVWSIINQGDGRYEELVIYFKGFRGKGKAYMNLLQHEGNWVIMKCELFINGKDAIVVIDNKDADLLYLYASTRERMK